MEFSGVAIFWMSFAAFIGPVFLIALVCSIRKAIITRKEIIRRIQLKNETTVGEEQDAEIVASDTNIRKKPNIKLIEDESRRREFRGASGSLLLGRETNYVTSPNMPKFKDTNIDSHRDAAKLNQPKNTNRSNAAGGDVTRKDTAPQKTTTAFIHEASSSVNKSNNHHNNVGRGSNNHTSKHYYANNVSNDIRDSEIIVQDNDATSGLRYQNKGQCVYNNGRRKSVGDGSSSQYCNGHGITDDALYEGANVSHNHDKDNSGLKPGSNNNRTRRHSVNSTSRIPKVNKNVDMELNALNATRSKSEDNLMDEQSDPSIPHLSNGGRGSDNRAFSRSTETTIM